MNELRKKNSRDSESNPDRPPLPTAPPAYYHQPPPVPREKDEYSHTASSTAGYAQTNAYPVLTNSSQERQSQSLLGRIESTATSFLGNIVGQDTAVSVSHKINSAVTNGRIARELLKNGTVVQIVSKTSSHPLQIVMSPNGTLTFDANGFPNTFNTYFTVEEVEKGRLRFHNNYNYLAFYFKQPTVITLPPGTRNNAKVEFRIHDILGNPDSIALESCEDKNCFIQISNDGNLKTKHIKEKTIEAQFSVIPVIFNAQVSYPYQQGAGNSYNAYQSNEASGYASPQPPVYVEQPLAPPPPYSTTDPFVNPSVSAGLYPKF